MSNSKQNSMFSLTRLLLVARKEFSDLLRDRKSIFWGCSRSQSPARWWWG